jgi:ribosome-associated translation inhibitor RaiA/cold shock CspA family protein
VQTSPEISYLNVDKTEALDSLIRKEIDKLHRFADDIMTCSVVVDRPNLHQKTGNPYTVRIELSVPPGKRLVVTEGQHDHEMHEELPAVIRGAFESMERRLRSVDDKRKGDVKQHAEPLGFVAAVHLEEGYAFLRTPEGRELYMHENSLLDAELSELQVGTGISFTEELGEQGPQVSSGRIVNPPPRL